MSVSPDTSMMCKSESDSESDKDDDRPWVWLDELCLEPITSVHGCSRLCNACLLILGLSAAERIDNNENMSLRHLRYWTTLRSSAERGCLLCIRLLDTWKWSGDEYKATTLLRSQATVPVRDHGVEFHCSISSKDAFFYLVNPALNPMTHLNNRLKCSLSTSSPESKFLAGSWLQHCLQFHAGCQPYNEQSKIIPARLIDIRLINHAPTLRLIETGGQLREERYMTLSYCWGDAQFPTLRIDNEQQLKNSIAFETLPKVFQDAIHVAGWFQVTYLWIDSLCIIQDSHDDWIRESCRMKDIYRNSFLTVAATGATDPSRGCFRDRNPSLVEPIKYCVSANEREEYISIRDEHRLNEAINSSPLSKRAWAFQERLLSPRVLHFGRKKLHWECNEMSACETCPGGIQPNTSRRHTSFSRSLSVPKGQLMTRHENFLGEVWTPIVYSYSWGALTKFSDKCLAISGIAEQAQSLCRETYIAGFWRKNFEAQLLWSINDYTFIDREDRPTPPYKRPTTYVAPSWSWLSVDGPISFYSRGDLHLLLEIFDIDIEFSNNNEFGTIKKGRLQVRGWLSAGTWGASWIEHYGGHCGELRSIRGHPCDVNSVVKMDTAEETEEVVCLPVGWDTVESITLDDQSDLASTHGLLLTKTGVKSDEYRRIGVFRIDGHPTGLEVLRPFFQQRLKNGRWRKRRKTTFTIV